MKRYLIITGAGRPGATLLVQLLNRLGMGTDCSDTISESHPNGIASVKWDIRHADAPRIVESASLGRELDGAMAEGGIEIEHVFVPMRDLSAAAAGSTDVDGAGDWEDFAARESHGLFVTLAKCEIPHTLLSFPRMAEDPLYLFGRLAPVLGSMSYDEFLAGFQAVVAPGGVCDVKMELPPSNRCPASAEVGSKTLPQSHESNPLWNFFRNHEGPMIHKWHHYFDVYHRHFARYRNTNACLLEFGVSHGGSLRMWRDYLGPRARIIGVDCNPDCLMHAEGRTEIIIGDQEDRAFLEALRKKVGDVDILIDDGGHTMAQQLATFDVMFEAVAADGVYLVEDLHTSYWPEYGGGWKRPGTFVEFAKSLVDRLNAWHSVDQGLEPDGFTKAVTGMHFYDSIVVFEKMRNPMAPVHSMHGHITLPNR